MQANGKTGFQVAVTRRGVLFMSGTLITALTPHYLLGNALLNASYFTNPLILSLLLGQRYARTGNELAVKLQEVQQLSARTRAQEQEKQ